MSACSSVPPNTLAPIVREAVSVAKFSPVCSGARTSNMLSSVRCDAVQASARLDDAPMFLVAGPRMGFSIVGCFPTRVPRKMRLSGGLERNVAVHGVAHVSGSSIPSPGCQRIRSGRHPRETLDDVRALAGVVVQKSVSRRKLVVSTTSVAPSQWQWSRRPTDASTRADGFR